MAFISYAQNLEDVMLHRALGHIQNGFYVDVGANDPVLDSVTKAFYDKGWSGINIEPIYEHFQKLVNARPRDINLHCGTGKIAGELQFYHIPGTGLSTGMAEIAREHEVQGWQSAPVTVPIFPMKELLAPYAGREIHFLKIDVEGMEEDVIAGMDFEKHRPWILIIEAIAPLVPTPTYATWEPAILSAGYEYVYNDGVNRYYLANEHPELKGKFAHPPNCFDLYETSSVANLETGLRSASEKVENLMQANQKIRAELDVAVKARDAEAKAKNEIEKQVSAALQQIAELRDNETMAQAMRQLLSDQARQMEQLTYINKLLETELGTRRSLDEKMKQMAELGQINARFAGEIKNLKEELLAARKQAFDIASRSEAEIQRLRRLLYSASTGTHLYRAWHVLTGDKHYRQGDKTNALRKPLKCYTNLRVPWHTHFYRGGLALFVKGEKPWHTHIYRGMGSFLGVKRYKHVKPKPDTAGPAGPNNQVTVINFSSSSDLDVSKIAISSSAPEIQISQVKAAVERRVKLAREYYSKQ
jgi:FkbM family methyltransferase